MNRSHLKHSTASTAPASTSRMASSYPGRYFRRLAAGAAGTGLLIWRTPAGRSYATTQTAYPI